MMKTTQRFYRKYFGLCCEVKEMYDIYGDWNLVIAAYNCGPGTINKAIRRAGGETEMCIRDRMYTL